MDETIRQRMIELLAGGEYTDRDLSQFLGISEKDVVYHLEHIARSVQGQKRKLKVIPARCMECGFTFEDRRRFSKPGRCPRCKGEHLQDPRYHIQ
ncbi:transcriptional regulator [Desulforhabdus sp. TSK]|uniref:transcriptional regulator n=1 Tax=Desulforhabdus sp. TSK TaxID=2925014 RepID=UPI001FC8D43F|nr:transcriptional regulator [Desulforhabdus sp. TSK]GKT07649.1 transcriptional regulator [Desulforhabdus sp. TSK]